VSTRLDQLPGGLNRLAETVAHILQQIAELRARRPDMSAADALLAPFDADPTRWPQTSLTSYTAISTSYNVAWHQQLHVRLTTTTSGGGVGNVRITINGTQWGPVVAAGAPFDYTDALPAGIAIGDEYQLTVEAQRTSGAGTVHAQTQLIRALP
jgi:hypothetical protein